ncbi:uncharacterized protein LOC144708078 [Wolffia australiana]
MEGPCHSREEEIMEIRSLRRIISAYLNYSDAALADVKRYERSFKKLSSSHKALLPHLPSKYQSLRRCISINANFILNMIQAFDPPVDMSLDADFDEHSNTEMIGNGQLTASDLKRNAESENCSETEQSTCHDDSYCSEAIPSSNTCANSSPSLNVPLVDVDKVRCIIRNIVRDWALEGKKEREECYKPILEELQRLFPDRSADSPPHCLVPGAGLGRLALEISCLGFLSQGNEFSYYMMICSSFILNYTEAVGQWTIYPWIHSNCNSLSDEDQLRPVQIPDIHLASAGITEGFSMCAGDFVEVYGDARQEGTWDAVVTCFFIDTAHNVAEYIKIIAKILKPGGVWINLGPLLYHFAESYGPDEMSLELSLDDVKKVSFHYGFELEMEKTVATTYTSNPRSMMQVKYNAAFWTMRKRRTEA